MDSYKVITVRRDDLTHPLACRVEDEEQVYVVLTEEDGRISWWCEACEFFYRSDVVEFTATAHEKTM